MTLDCYCVCHSPYASRAWCEHCQGDNSVGRLPRCTVPDPSNANGTCARALPCGVHGGETAGQGDSIGFVGLSEEAEEEWFDR